MDFQNGQTVFRDRRRMTASPYNPSRSVTAEYDPTLSIALPGSWVGPSSSTAVPDATREQILTSVSLFCTDPTVDVIVGDRIRSGGTLDDLDSGTRYRVEVIPDAPTNPFTGWRPYKEIPLVGVTG